MLPKGYKLSVAEAAVKGPGRKDMALIYSTEEASLAGTFTTNKVKAAPVRICMKRARSGRGRAIVVNSGNANACTGAPGMSDAEEMAELCASGLGVGKEQVYVCSTGVIGRRLPMERIRPAIGVLAQQAGGAGLEDVARAIMTTDTFPKFLSSRIRLGASEGMIAGVCKGAGMIEPDMATMLCFIFTDIAVDRKALKVALKASVGGSFNSITVDGCRSTNDTVLAMANGTAGNRELTEGSRYFGVFASALSEMAAELSRMIVRDGEGATKVVEVEVTGARSVSDARKAARAIANSLLVKTALYGSDPNWGRVISAIGSCGVSMIEDKVDIYLGGVKVVSRGVSTGLEKAAGEQLTARDTGIRAVLNVGNAKAKVVTCDITEEYIRINSGYTT